MQRACQPSAMCTDRGAIAIRLQRPHVQSRAARAFPRRACAVPRRGPPPLVAASRWAFLLPVLSASRCARTTQWPRHPCAMKRRCVRRTSAETVMPVSAEALADSIWTAAGDLPPYCGTVSSPSANILVVGVSHLDGGESGRAARELIERVEPDVCLVELDQVRFSRLIAVRRGLPWPYAPKRGARYSPPLVAQAVRDFLFVGLGAASSVAGVNEGGGDEFYEAFEAADAAGALVVPGDVAVARALDSVASSLRKGLADPVGQVMAGFTALFLAFGGLASRPQADGALTRSCGITVPAALLANGGARSGPLVRSTLAGAALALTLNLLLTRGVATEGENALRGLGVDAFSEFFLLLIVLSIVAIAMSAFGIAFLRERDEQMVAKLTTALRTMQRLQGDEAPTEKQNVSVVTENGQPLWCRFRKWSLAGHSFGDPSVESRSAAPAPMCADGALGQSCSTDRPRRLTLHSRPSNPPTTWTTLTELAPLPSAPSESSRPWLPLFTVRRPLLENEVRRFSLFEPRFLALFDSLAAAGCAVPGLRFAVVFAPHGAERPVGTRTEKPPLGVEVDVVLEGVGRIVEAMKVEEGVGEDGRRRWRVDVVGTAQVFCTRDCNLFHDELGALWATPRECADHPCPDPLEKAATRPRGKVQAVAVVGLLHVNGIVRGLQQHLEKV